MKASMNKKIEKAPGEVAREVVIEEKNGKPSPREVQRIWRLNPSYSHTNSTIIYNPG